MKLILARHGETEENIKGIIQGQKIGGKLTEKGKEQAKKLAERLKEEKIDIIYSSDLKRALDTAKEIAKYHDVSFITSKELRERNYGNLEGKKVKFKEVRDGTTIVDKTGESLGELYKRAEKFLHKLIKKHKDESVLVVAHGTINRALIAVITEKKPEDIYRIEKLKNTSISIFEINEDKNHKIILFNCTKHLD